jgi:hypothetical protein
MAVWIVSLVVPGRGPTGSRQLITAPDVTMRSRYFTKLDRLTTRFGLPARFGDRRWVRWLLLAVFLPTAGFLTLALSTPAPLTLRNSLRHHKRAVRKGLADPGGGDKPFKVRRRPSFHRSLHQPVNAVLGGQAWPTKLRSGQTASYTLVAPDVGSMPFITQPFVVQAVTAQPESISSSSAYTPEQFDCYITPVTSTRRYR